MAEAAREHALASLKGFRERKEYSDMVLTCGEDTYKLHKLVVCSRAEFFRAAVDFGGQEAETGKIDLPDDDPEAVKLLVQYLYEADYEPKMIEPRMIDLPVRKRRRSSDFCNRFPHSCRRCDSYDEFRNICPHHTCGVHCNYNCRAFICEMCTQLIAGSASQLLTHAQLYELADKYSVVGLKALCQEKFKRACAIFWDYDSFPIAANYVFSTTSDNDKGLRDIVSATISEHMVLLQKPEVEALMTEFNGLAFGLLKAKAARANWR